MVLSPNKTFADLTTVFINQIAPDPQSLISPPNTIIFDEAGLGLHRGENWYAEQELLRYWYQEAYVMFPSTSKQFQVLMMGQYQEGDKRKEGLLFEFGDGGTFWINLNIAHCTLIDQAIDVLVNLDTYPIAWPGSLHGQWWKFFAYFDPTMGIVGGAEIEGVPYVSSWDISNEVIGREGLNKFTLFNFGAEPTPQEQVKADYWLLDRSE